MVASSIKSPGFGNLITFTHSYGFSSRYAHLQKRLVHRAEFVYKGQLVQMTGHFEGKFWCQGLTIFPGGLVSGKVHCQQMVIEPEGGFLGHRAKMVAQSHDDYSILEPTGELLKPIEV